MFRTSFLLLTLLALFLCSCVSAQVENDMVAEQSFPAQREWLDKWDNSLAYTLEALMVLSEEELDFRATEDQMTLREQFHHMAGNIYFLTSKFIHQPAGFDRAATFATMGENADKAEVAETLTKAYFFGAKAARMLSEAQWDEPAPEFFAGPKSKRVIFYLLQDHATHHRAQTLVYLRLLGHQPPAYRGW